MSRWSPGLPWEVVACRLLVPAYSPVLAVVALSPASAIVLADAERWGELDTKWGAPVQPRHGRLTHLAWLLSKREFRSLVYYRLRRAGVLWNVVSRLLGMVWKPQVALLISCPHVGPGLFIQHGFATTIGAARIGRNGWVNQQVTIGTGNQGERPWLGDDVQVRTGAIVLGGIRLEDGCRVNAGAVVIRDVPAGCSVAGVPAKVVRRTDSADPPDG